MTGSSRDVRNERMWCDDCDAPVVKTEDDRFVCVDCGRPPST